MIKIRNAANSNLDAIMKTEKSSFIPQIRENNKVFAERIKNFSEFFPIFYGEENPESEIGSLRVEFFERIPEFASEIKLWHIPRRRENLIFNENLKAGDFSICFYASSFCVVPENREKGIGGKRWKLAINYFENDARFVNRFKNKGFLPLANENWRAAILIHKKSGFETTKTFENFFPRRKKFSNGILTKKSAGGRSNEI